MRRAARFQKRLIRGAAYGVVEARRRPVMHRIERRPVMTLDAALDRVMAMLGERIEWTRIEAFLPVADAIAASFTAAQ